MRIRFCVLGVIPLMVGCLQAPAEKSGLRVSAPRVTPDRRPAVGQSLPGRDLMAKTRELNAKGTEPPFLNRKGRAVPTSLRPLVKRTATGFEAKLPVTPYGSFEPLVATPAYYRGRVLAGTLDGHEVHALDVDTLQGAWTARLSDHGPTAPACDDGVCVFNTHSCTMFAVDADTGRHLWSYWLGDPQLATPVISGGVVYTSYPGPRYDAELGGRVYVIAAFDLHTGTPSWRRWIDDRVNEAPVSHNGKIYVATYRGTLYEFAEKDGAVLAVRQNEVASAPVVAGGSVFFSRDGDAAVEGNDLLAVAHPVFPDLDRKRLQRKITPRPRPVVAQHRLITADNGTLSAVDRKTGRRLWDHHLSGVQLAEIPAPMLYAAGSLLVATGDGAVLRIDADSGEAMASYPLGRRFASQPIVHDGWIYAGTRSGMLVGYDTGERALTGWPMFGGAADRRGARDDG